MSTRRYIRTRDLQVGMRMDQSIVDTTGRVLLARGSALDQYLINSLKDRGIAGVYIREGEDDPEEVALPTKQEYKASPQAEKKIQELNKEDRSKVKLNESVKKRVAEGISYLYSNTSANTFADTTKSIADDLMNAITDNDALAFDIGMLKVSDEYTFKHSVDVATIAMVIAKKMNMNDKQVYEIGVAGLLHDIGKSKIPNEILNKPGKLTEEEFAVMKQHPVFSYRIIKDNSDISDAVKIAVLQHHEKTNGRGYPMAVGADKITTYAKVLAIADIYDALVTERPYKSAFSQRDAIEMIMAMTIELDIDIMKSFLGSVILYPVGSNITLSNGDRVRVVENYVENVLRPKVVSLRTGKVYDLANDIKCASIIIP